MSNLFMLVDDTVLCDEFCDQFTSMVNGPVFRCVWNNEPIEALMVPVGKTAFIQGHNGLHYTWATTRWIPHPDVTEHQGTQFVVGDIVRTIPAIRGQYIQGIIDRIEPGIDEIPLLRCKPSPEYMEEFRTRTGSPFGDNVFLDETGCFLVYHDDACLEVNGIRPEWMSDVLEVYHTIYCDGRLYGSGAPETQARGQQRISKRSTRPVADKISEWLSNEDRLNQITWGIELEFDSWGDFSEGTEFDEERCSEDMSERLADTDNGTLARAICQHRGWTSTHRTVIDELIRHSQWDDPEEYATAFGIEWSSLVDILVDQNRDNEDSEFWSRRCDIPNVDIGRDGSVDGPECRTRGALSWYQVRQAIKAVFEQSGGADVNTGCSAHIHCRVGEIHHKMESGSLLYQCLMFALLDRIEDWPATQIDRVQSDAIQWFRPQTQSPNTKYSPIFCHPQGTLEFRLWGNCRGSSEGYTRLELTRDALVEGYSTFAGDEDLIVYSSEDFAEACKQSFDRGVPLSTIIPQFAPTPTETIQEQTTGSDWSIDSLVIGGRQRAQTV